MYKKIVCLMTLVLMLGLSSTALATDYYVSPSGDDSNPGTSPSTAWQTIDKVNSVSFSAGDSILFEAGEMFIGSLYFDASDAGTATNPVTVSSYGSGGDGRATISSGTSDGLYAYDCAGFDVTDLKFIGSGYNVPGGYGIRFYTDRGDGVKLERVYIDNVDVSGYYEIGIEVYADDSSLSGFRDIRITDSISHDNGDKGISTSGVWPPQAPAHSLEDVYVGGCTTYNNFGIPGREPHTGNGIILSGITNAMIEFCESYNNGELDDTGGGGPIGIWYWEVHNGTIQFCESHHNKSAPNTKDGGGFDLDGGCINCIVQYNYSHDNHGASIGVFQFRGASTFTDNAVRYNVFQNDGQKRHGLIDFWAAGGGKVENTDIYNNTLYVGPDTVEAAFFKVTSGSKIINTRIFNNIILTVPGKACADVGSGFTFLGNCYWSGGGPLNINGSTSLAEWQATGQEILDGQPVGYETDPKLVNAGGSSDTDYKLQSSSPMINGSLDLPTLFGIDVGPQDYWGTSIPQDGAYDVGSHEGVAGPPDTDPPTPDPMTWATVPYATGDSSIAMVATTASDVSGVEYYFACTAGGGNDSIWQDSTSYEDTGLSPGAQYCYQVKARDKSLNQNETGWSTTECATTNEPDTTPPSPDPMTWATVPYATGSSSISMVATTASDESGVEYYFDCLTAGGHDSDWQDSTSYTDTGLDPNTQYCYRVQARDKSVNQNATAWSTTECATTDPVSGETSLFSDGFESGDFVAGGWTTWDIVKITKQAAYTGTYGAEPRRTGSIEKAVSTSGYTDIRFKYVRRAYSLEAGELFYAEWWDGTGWNVLESTNDESWLVQDWALPAAAANNTNFKIRFRLNASSGANDKGQVDDVEVTGNQ